MNVRHSECIFIYTLFVDCKMVFFLFFLLTSTIWRLVFDSAYRKLATVFHVRNKKKRKKIKYNCWLACVVSLFWCTAGQNNQYKRSDFYENPFIFAQRFWWDIVYWLLSFQWVYGNLNIWTSSQQNESTLISQDHLILSDLQSVYESIMQ